MSSSAYRGEKHKAVLGQNDVSEILPTRAGNWSPTLYNDRSPEDLRLTSHSRPHPQRTYVAKARFQRDGDEEGLVAMAVITLDVSLIVATMRWETEIDRM